ncbi:FixH family protein [Pedobacter sp. WC2423]|uniref:FixH family protein n=1 Tax=Pedobacter sp. WC2423 TaxID=3234142 RepID=UPI003466F59C
MNWGIKVLLGMGTFMSFIIVLVVIMFNSKTDALVDNDYYEKGINYDKVYKLKEQVNIDHAKPEIVVSRETISLVFKEQAKGNLRLMRTSDKRLDRAMPFETDQNRKVLIPAQHLPKGSWRLIVEWESQSEKYLIEQEINIK